MDTGPKPQYAVIIYRTDENHIVTCETEDYDTCYEHWETLVAQWKECGNSPQPFIVKEPVIDAFAPNLIYSITIREKGVASDSGGKHPNPYNEQMRKEGFSKTFNNHSQGDSILDGGYKL